MLHINLVLQRLLQLVELEPLLLDDGLDAVGLDGTVHFLLLLLGADEYATDNAGVLEGVHEVHFGLVAALGEATGADQTDYAFGFDGLPGLADCAVTACGLIVVSGVFGSGNWRRDEPISMMWSTPTPPGAAL